MSWTASTRSDKTTANGNKTLLTTDATKFPVQAALQHVVMTYDPVNGQKVYVNGVDTGAKDTVAGGSLASWDNTFALVLGAEANGKDQWLGVIRFVAIHSRALTADQIMQNYNAGVGEKYFMLFDVADLSGVPQSYVQVTASVLDNYAYQFTAPTFISLNPNATVANIPISGIRYGVNGAMQSSGQSWQMVNTMLGGSAYTAASGQLLSKVGGIVASDKGADSDVMFLTFDQLGSHSHPFVNTAAPAAGRDLRGRVAADQWCEVLRPDQRRDGADHGRSAHQPDDQHAVQLTAAVAADDAMTCQPSWHLLRLRSRSSPMPTARLPTKTTLFPGLDTTQTNPATYFGAAPAAGSPATGNRALVINPLVTNALGGATTNAQQAQVVTDELNLLITNLAATTPAPTSGAGRPGAPAARCSVAPSCPCSDRNRREQTCFLSARNSLASTDCTSRSVTRTMRAR